MNHSFLFFFMFASLSILAQDNRVELSGIVLNDTIEIENVHIINKSSQRGTLSNSRGRFKISATEKDTLIFSNIQFENKIIIINLEHMVTKFIQVKLNELNNELDEVIVKQYDDMSEELGLPNAGKKPLNKLERNLNHYSQKSTPIVILEALMFKPGGIDDVYNIISGNRKRDRKLKALIDADRQRETDLLKIGQIREHFGENLFLKTLQMEKELINDFIYYCFSDGIVLLFDKGRMIEVIDIFLKKEQPFKDSLNQLPED